MSNLIKNLKMNRVIDTQDEVNNDSALVFTEHLSYNDPVKPRV